MSRKERLAVAARDYAAKRTNVNNSYQELFDAFFEGSKWADRNQIGALDEDYAWSVYNFINKWKNGEFGEIPLQKALKESNL